jgi:hypothetical protein
METDRDRYREILEEEKRKLRENMQGGDRNV